MISKNFNHNHLVIFSLQIKFNIVQANKYDSYFAA